MRSKWLALGLLALTAAACGAEPPGEQPPAKRAGKNYAPYPNPGSGYVTDLTGVLTREQEERIEHWLWQAEKKTGVEVAVVIVASTADYPEAPRGGIEAFARGLFDAYGVGNLPKNDGVLLLVALRDRKARIELGAGYGHARDGDSARIMNGTIVPRFRQGDYAGGITEGVRDILREFAGFRPADRGAPAGQSSGASWLQTLNWKTIAPILVLLFFLLIAGSLFKSGKTGWGWVTVGLGIVAALAVYRLLATVARNMPSGSDDSDGGGDSSSWSPGGFGGGFGGGSSGGGGATGSW
jgi:uncharacterized protein